LADVVSLGTSSVEEGSRASLNIEGDADGTGNLREEMLRFRRFQLDSELVNNCSIVV
jgi:hypothetical protein